jgi:TRAP-type C4-dicarboxylate transport system permease small subunit
LGWIRPYLNNHGDPGNQTGANYGIQAMADWTQALDLAKRRGERKWFLFAYPLSFLIIIVSILFALFKEGNNV